MFDKLATEEQRYEELMRLLGTTEVQSDPSEYRKHAKSLSDVELFRMYSKFAERNGWRIELMSSHDTGVGGLKEAIAMIEGRGVYSKLKYESGVHRVQRVPSTEASGRIHTSTVTVAVLPEAEE